jgi:hypothetical protein
MHRRSRLRRRTLLRIHTCKRKYSTNYLDKGRSISGRGSETMARGWTALFRQISLYRGNHVPQENLVSFRLSSRRVFQRLRSQPGSSVGARLKRHRAIVSDGPGALTEDSPCSFRWRYLTWQCSRGARCRANRVHHPQWPQWRRCLRQADWLPGVRRYRRS